MELAWTPRRQGDAGEFSAMVWLHDAGAIVCKPLFEHPDYDLIADFGDRIHRVQVKTSTYWAHNRFVVSLSTRGGNQSWNGIVERLDATRCDRVFVQWETAAADISRRPLSAEEARSCWEVRSTRATRSTQASPYRHGHRRR